MSPRVAAIAGYINSTDPLCLFTHTRIYSTMMPIHLPQMFRIRLSATAV